MTSRCLRFQIILWKSLQVCFLNICSANWWTNCNLTHLAPEREVGSAYQPIYLRIISWAIIILIRCTTRSRRPSVTAGWQFERVSSCMGRVTAKLRSFGTPLALTLPPRSRLRSAKRWYSERRARWPLRLLMREYAHFPRLSSTRRSISASAAIALSSNASRSCAVCSMKAA